MEKENHKKVWQKPELVVIQSSIGTNENVLASSHVPRGTGDPTGGFPEDI